MADGLYEAIMDAHLAKAIRPDSKVSISRIKRQWKVKIT